MERMEASRVASGATGRGFESLQAYQPTPNWTTGFREIVVKLSHATHRSVRGCLGGGFCVAAAHSGRVALHLNPKAQSPVGARSKRKQRP
jgi:phosphomevalonate kinase